MILNAFSAVAAFAATLRFVVGLILVVLSVRALIGLRAARSVAPANDPVDERRHWLLFVLAASAFGLAVVSWPLLYLVLQSFVPEWPGVMCIQGVTRIGTNSVGSAAHLPGLLAFLQASKPALVFLAGIWLVLHVARQRGGAGAGRVLFTLLACALLASADAAAELAYLGIPKAEKFLAAGCCSVRNTAAAGSSGAPVWAVGDAPGFFGPTAAFVGVGAAVLAFLFLARRSARPGLWLGLAAAAAAVSLPLGSAYVTDVAAPAFLHLPHHHCAYCMIAAAPESLLGIALFLLACFAVGWAATARWLGGRSGLVVETRLVRLALFGFGAALAMALARALA